MPEVEQLREAAGSSGVPTSVVRYPDAGHDFYCAARPAAYRELAAKQAAARTLDFFAAHVTS